ncbi:MAG: ATP-binding protein [bacterium]|nr:ATP-binding protein [bacterium]
MTPETRQFIDNYTGDELSFKRNMMALDALSKLARRFSNHPDLQHLSSLLLLTLAGQFSISSAFALYCDPSLSESGLAYMGLGKFMDHSDLREITIPDCIREHFVSHPDPVQVDEYESMVACQEIKELLVANQVKVVVPLVHKDGLIGILGLGEKVTKKEFENNDLEILSTLAHSLTPFISNSILFRELSDLNCWYVDILSSVKQAVLIFDSDYRLKLANLSAASILEKLREDAAVIGNNKPTIDELFSQSAFPGWSSRIKNAHILGAAGTLENLVACVGEDELIFNVRTGSFKRDNRSEFDIFVTLDDVTDQKASEQRLFEVEKFAEKGVMASTISHELNNFLGLILGGTELAGMALAKGNTEKVAATLEKIKKNVGKMERFTAGLVDYTRLNTKKSETNLNSVITDVLSFVAVQKKFTRIAITTELAKEIPPFVVDADQMSQLIMNLVNNAADAIIDSRKPTRKIAVSTRFENGNVILEISDNGKGIDPELKGKLFKAHFTTKEKGHGYGLVTCSKIIDNHKGKIEIESEVGQGATFRLSFPVDQSVESQPSAV